MKIFLVLALLALGAASQTVDYCDKELCKKYTASGAIFYAKHIACKNNGDFTRACPRTPSKRSLVPMTKDLISLILQLHNEYRRKVATGSVPGYAKANQMIEMSWNSELAKLAELEVKTCTFEHDQCRSTVEFKYPGQNLGLTSTTNPEYKDPIEIIHNHTAEWFIEYKKCDMSYVRSYRSSNNLIGHFTQLVVDQADRVGCAMSKYDNGNRNIFFACDYSVANIIEKPIYVAGDPCSKCKSGCSRTYPGLCNTNEKDYWTTDEKNDRIAPI